MQEGEQGQAKTESIGQKRGSAAPNTSQMSSLLRLGDGNTNMGHVDMHQDAKIEGPRGEGSGHVVDNLGMEVVTGEGFHP